MERDGSIGCDDDLVPLVGEGESHELGDVVVVVHDKRTYPPPVHVLCILRVLAVGSDSLGPEDCAWRGSGGLCRVGRAAPQLKQAHDTQVAPPMWVMVRQPDWAVPLGCAGSFSLVWQSRGRYDRTVAFGQ